VTRSWLPSDVNSEAGPRAKKNYYLTAKGEDVLRFVKDRVKELWLEIGDGTAKGHSQ